MGSFGNVNRWFTTIVNQPNAKAVLGEVVLCTKMAEFDAKKFAEFSGKDNKKKEPKPKAEPAKKKDPQLNLPWMTTVYLLSPRRKTPWMLCQRGHSTWKNGRGFTLITMRMNLSNGSGSISITRIIQSGKAITSSTVSSRWSSCLVILLEGCSNVWKR